MIEFVLNRQLICTDKPAAMPLLDFIRREQRLTGAKVGCGEGDCGACLVLEGRLEEGRMQYRPIVSCLTPLANAHGRHIVTVEGLNLRHLSPVQEAVAEHSAAQCGFCTPGVIVALTALCLSEAPLSPEKAIAALDGNLCRCTGYQSLKKAALAVAARLPVERQNRAIPWLIEQGWLPAYFDAIPGQVAQIPRCSPAFAPGRPILGGGTDLLVQQAGQLMAEAPNLLCERWEIGGICEDGDSCFIGGGLPIAAILENRTLNRHIPGLGRCAPLIASTPVRNMGTLGGNLANASPIADLAIIFLAFETRVLLNGPSGRRELPLEDFYLAYKQIDKSPSEYLEGLRLRLPGARRLFSFEKVSKRTHLDIASVNTAIGLDFDGETMSRVRLSAGGVSPVPLLLRRTGAFLEGKMISESVLGRANALMQEEISPISDIRGSADYKRLLLRQLFFAHFLKLFPEHLSFENIHNEGLLAHEKHSRFRAREGAIRLSG